MMADDPLYPIEGSWKSDKKGDSQVGLRLVQNAKGRHRDALRMQPSRERLLEGVETQWRRQFALGCNTKRSEQHLTLWPHLELLCVEVWKPMHEDQSRH